jgi:hypothetical protein
MAFFPKQQASREIATQVIAFSSSSATAGAKFGTETFQIRLTADAHVCYQIGDGVQTATTASSFLPQFMDRFVIVQPGQQIAAIRAASDGNVTAASGTIWITEIG